VRHETSIEIAAAPERVWSVMTDVERWPEWSDSISSLQKLTRGEFSVGSKVRIRQPKLPASVWAVTIVEPGRYFAWENHGPVMSSVAGHRITPDAGGCVVTLSVDQRGPVAPLLAFLMRDVANHYLRQEATGLKRRCEKAA